MFKFLIALLLFSSVAFGGATTDRQLDKINHSSGGTQLTVPSVGTDVLSNSSTNTLTNKSISGSTNTLSNIPVSTEMVQEVPSGTVNSSNVTFTLANTPGTSSSAVVWLDGLVLTQGAGKDYTISGATITFATAPATGQSLWAEYAKH